MMQEAIYPDEINDGFQARKIFKPWMAFYNEDSPHSAIGYNVPIAMHYPDGVTSPSS